MKTSSRPTKRLASTLDEQHVALSKKPEVCEHKPSVDSTATIINPLASGPSIIEIHAFGLEDQAEALISKDAQSWTLAHLSKWRHDTFNKAMITADNQQSIQPNNSKLSSKEYLRQRQRAYRTHCLASSSKHK
ncbi:unnamed protein product [Peronospora belbahrii]|uniref:Uncharacterized protein n=1 Tax=Peronospora belbahrii TaxID=622444 RepID=A0AAU9LD10_9STRA|nr:unnamed protein product [Peronospora belbahrii]